MTDEECDKLLKIKIKELQNENEALKEHMEFPLLYKNDKTISNALMAVELKNIKQAIEDYIKEYEIYDDFNRHNPRLENHTIKHLSYCDMQKKVCDTVLGILGHLKEYYSCPRCGSSKDYFVEVRYGRCFNATDNMVYEIRECTSCGYGETLKRLEYKYKEEEWKR